MKFKKLIVICLFLLAIFMIGSVSAADAGAISTDISAASDNDEVIDVENDLDESGELETNPNELANTETNSNELGDAEPDSNELANTETDSNKIGDAEPDSNELDDVATYSDLRSEIGTGLIVELTKSYYRYTEGDGDTISIENLELINGNGAVIDMEGSNIRAFYVNAGVKIKNLTIKNANYDGDGGAIFFNKTGTVENCNFINNSGIYGGAIWFEHEGLVTNCNFTNNHGDYGGAIGFMYLSLVKNCTFLNNTAIWGAGMYFNGLGNVKDCDFTNNIAESGGAVMFWCAGEVETCNFTNNSAENGGAVYFADDGSASNSSFINNTASYWGGAVFMGFAGIVKECNFTGNYAPTGSAIYFWDIEEHKIVSESIFLNNRADADAKSPFDFTQNENIIEIRFMGRDNLLNAIYSSGEVTLLNVSYWGADGIANTGILPKKQTGSPYEKGQNITVNVYVDGNLVLNTTKVTDDEGKIVLEDISGNYLIIAHHEEDSYYSEAKSIFTNISHYVNLTDMKTHSKTVNITAKSNVNNEIIQGKLMFILPNGEKVNANYSNGTWWASYTFDKYGTYNVAASYEGLDGVIINNATISIIDSSKITASNVKVTYAAGKYYTINVYGVDGKLLNNAKVIIKVKGKTFKTLTTKNGVAKFKVTNAPGTYKMTISALGKSVKKTLTVKHLLTLKKVKVKKSAKKLVLTATLKKVNGKYLKNKKIKFKFKGKKYTAKTNKKGVAKVTIKKSVLKKLKVGKKVTYQATYKKDTVKKTVKIKK